MSVEFQKFKVSRLKTLDSNAELRKDFIKNMLPVQEKLDKLLLFSQGILNHKNPQNSFTPKRLRVGHDSSH
jgi:hypothetical protein